MMALNKLTILSISLLFMLILTNCSIPVATGVATKAVTVSNSDRSIGEYVDDVLIKAILKNSYFDQSEKIFFNVDVEVSQGRVLLTGTVDNIDLRIEATRIAWGVKGVQTVINEIQISESDNILNFADDLVISTKVYAKLMLDEEVNSLNYNIETVNKVVYIIGISSSSDEKKKAIDLTKEVFGVEEVVEYITIKSE
jgi:osmotically-inducible protein OsmY|tara:strand:+ start:39 stop:629 length:591 start_codon:yes stop_codon:yes gene_type:complete